MSEFARAEAAVPPLKIHQQTFKFMDLQPVYIQITEMDSSDWIWISAGASPLLQQQNALGGAGAHGGGGSGGG
ncbi:hypothetical protein BGX20_005266, partial [Mortierella sp. AD010]